MKREFATSIGFCTPSVSRFWVPSGSVAHCGELFTRWMWTDAGRLNQSELIYVNAVIVKALECNVFKKTNFFCDVIKGRSSSTCGPREISTSFPGNLHFLKPCLWVIRTMKTLGLKQWFSTWGRDPRGVVYHFSRVARAAEKIVIITSSYGWVQVTKIYCSSNK